MAYEIKVTPDAELDLRYLRKAEEQTIRESVPRFLAYEPDSPSIKRKPLDPNPHEADWALRLGDLRVLYAIDRAEQRVWVLRAGRKEGNHLFLRGTRVEMRVP